MHECQVFSATCRSPDLACARPPSRCPAALDLRGLRLALTHAPHSAQLHHPARPRGHAAGPGLHRPGPGRPQHGPGHHRGLRRQQRHQPLQPGLRRALQPAGVGDQPRRQVDPVPLGDRARACAAPRCAPERQCIPAGGYFLVGGGVHVAGARTTIPRADATQRQHQPERHGRARSSSPTRHDPATHAVVGCTSATHVDHASRSSTSSATARLANILRDRGNDRQRRSATRRQQRTSWRTATTPTTTRADVRRLGPGSPDSCDCVAPAALKITEVYTDGGQRRTRPTTTTSSSCRTPAAPTLPMTGLTLQYRAPATPGRPPSSRPLTGSMATGTLRRRPARRHRPATAPPCPAPEYTVDLDLSGRRRHVLHRQVRHRARPGHRRRRRRPVPRRPRRLGHCRRLRDRRR